MLDGKKKKKWVNRSESPYFFVLLVSFSGGMEMNWTMLSTRTASILNLLAISGTAIGPWCSSDFPWCRRMISRSCAAVRVPGGADFCSSPLTSAFELRSFGRGRLYFSTMPACIRIKRSIHAMDLITHSKITVTSNCVKAVSPILSGWNLYKITPRKGI